MVLKTILCAYDKITDKDLIFEVEIEVNKDDYCYNINFRDILEVREDDGKGSPKVDYLPHFWALAEKRAIESDVAIDEYKKIAYKRVRRWREEE